MDVTIVFVVMRMLERIIAVLIGAFLVHLGYTLFVKLPELTDSEGRVKLPNNISVYLSHIGPGAFFALFGSIVVALSIVFGMRLDQRPPSQTAPSATTIATVVGSVGGADNSHPAATEQSAISIQGIGEKPALEKVDEKKVRDAGHYIALLNSLDKQLNPALPMPDRVDITASVPGIKLALMETIWDTAQWGDWHAFRAWVEDGSESAPDRQLVKSAAVKFYNNGLSGDTQ